MSKEYYGLATRVLENDFARMEFLSTAGPRIVRFSIQGSQNNILAELPGLKWETPYGESLSSLVKIGPGESASHSEIWELYPDVEKPNTVEEAREILKQLSF